MAKRKTCHNCVYAKSDLALWARTFNSMLPAGPMCANQPDFSGRMRDCPLGRVCRNFRARPPIPKGETVKIIPLTNGFYAYVDAEDYEWLNQWHWRAYSAGYAGRWVKSKLLYMHREIMQPPKGMVVDHISGNGFDNTRANLRNVTRRQNSYNQQRHISGSSIYKGVVRDRKSDKWYAQIRSEGARPRSPLFDDEAEAARAYDELAVQVFGEYARLNFPEEWPAERRAQVYAQREKNRPQARGRKKATRRPVRKKPAGRKPRAARRSKAKSRKKR